MKTILLIEDNEFIRDNAAQLLTMAGYKILAATNGKAGIETAKKAIPDLIISDIMMPEMDGYSVLLHLKTLPETASVPILFLTAKSSKENMEYGLELGAANYLTKPYSDEDLLNSVKNILSK